MSGWDCGVRWHLETVGSPDWDTDPLALSFVRDLHLRCANGTAEDAYITSLIRTSLMAAERTTWRTLLPKTLVLAMDRFPFAEILLPSPPGVSVTSIEYTDENGDPQTLSGSPAEYRFIAPSGPKAGKARILPLTGETWPQTDGSIGSVRVTFVAGYPVSGSPAVADVPEDITHGRLLMIGELYKQRSESVHSMNQNPAIIRAVDIWKEYRAW